MLPHVALTLLNLETTYQGGIKGLKLCDKLTGVPLEIDIRSNELENKNFIEVGPSGAGKSFLQNYIAHQLFYMREHVVTIEIGRSFKKLSKVIPGAQHIEYNLNNPIEFNPFTISDFDFSKDKNDIDNSNVVFISTLMFHLWGAERKDNDSESVMADIIIDYYRYCKTNKSTPVFTGFYNYIDTFREENKNDQEFFNFNSFKRCLKKYYDGQYSNVFGINNLDLINCPFIVFELYEIKDYPDILPIVVLIIIEIIMEKFRRLVGINKVIILDEAWSMLKGHMITNYIGYMFRTCRKHSGATGIITQSVSEIAESPIGSALKSNTSTYFILDHSKNTTELPELQKTLGFTDNDIKILRTIENTSDYKEVLIKLNNTSKIYRVEVAEPSRLLYASDEKTTLSIKNMEPKFGGNIEYAINNIVDNKKI